MRSLLEPLVFVNIIGIPKYDFFFLLLLRFFSFLLLLNGKYILVSFKICNNNKNKKKNHNHLLRIIITAKITSVFDIDDDGPVSLILITIIIDARLKRRYFGC